MLGCCPLPASAYEDQPSPLFDQPLQKKRVALGPSSASKDETKELRCASFPAFMVKEIDDQEVGDAQISILPRGATEPPCQARNVAGEHVIPGNSWSGYVMGIKADFVFLAAADGVNGGLGFAIYRAPGAVRLFQDSVTLDRDGTRFQAIAAEGASLRLRYSRTYTGACSVPTDGDACWHRLAAETHLPPSPAPDCAAGYQAVKQDLAVARCEIAQRKDAACVTDEMAHMTDWDESPSVIGYDVEVVLNGTQKAMTPVGGPVTCRPAD